MLFQSELLSIFVVLSTWVNCSVLRSNTAAADKTKSIGLLVQTSQNATFGDGRTSLAEPATLDGDWLEAEYMRTIPMHPLSTLSLNTTTAGPPKYRCDGKAFGRNLNLQSCLRAISLMTPMHVPRTYGDRGRGAYDVNLPFRILSNDGLCAIDISNKKELDFDTIIPDDLKLSVRALIDICVRGSPNEGGVVTNLGQNGGLAVRVTPYRPKVQCGDRGSAPPFMTCRELLDRLPTTGVQERFGPIDDPSAQVVIPKYFTDDDERCGLTVATIDSTDVTDWYKVWAATIAVQVMCIEARKAGGVGYDLGKDSKLFVSIEDLQPDTPALGLTSANISALAASH